MLSIFILYLFISTVHSSCYMVKVFNKNYKVCLPTRYRGLDEAVKILKNRIFIPNDLYSKYDLVLYHSRTYRHMYKSCYKLQRIRQNLGFAWEHVMTDFGFTRVRNQPYDLINLQTRTVIQLKNSYDTGSSYAKKHLFYQLTKFKNENPNYTVIYASINYKKGKGKSKIKNGVLVLFGKAFTEKFFSTRLSYILRKLRAAIQ